MQVLLSMTGALLIAGTLMAAAQVSLPVKVYREGREYRGNQGSVINVPEDAGARYSLVSGYKVAGKPWAEVVVRRDSDSGTIYLSRAYDCARGTMRWLGEARAIVDISRSVSGPEMVRDRGIAPDSVEYSIARYACGL